MESTWTTSLPLVSVTGIEVAKTNASFLEVQYIYFKMALLLAIVASHLTGIVEGPLLITFNDIVSCCQEVFFLFKPFSPLFFIIGLGALIRMGRSGDLAVS